MDGWVILGVDANTKKFEKKIQEAEAQAEKKNVQINIETESINKSRAELSEVQKQAEKVENELTALGDQIARLNELNAKPLDALTQDESIELVSLEMMKLEDIEQGLIDKLQGYDNKMTDINNDIDKGTEKLKKQKEEYDNLINKAETLKKELKTTQLKNIQNDLQKTGNHISDIIRKVAFWALALVGIRSAYGAITQAASTLSKYNEQIATNMEYLHYVVAMALQPVIERMIQLAYKLLAYINYISQAWFGVNLFANASAKSFQKANDNLKKTSKTAKELKKQLAGFDEMNVIQDNTSSNADTSGGAGLPSFDLGKGLGDQDVPAWIKWIADNKDLVLSALLGIVTALLLIQMGVDGIMALGIGAIVMGIVLLIQDIIKFIQDPTWDNFANILRDLAIILAGIALVMIAIEATNPVGWIILIIAAVVGLVAIIIKNWDKIKEVLGKVASWINDNIIKPVVEFFKGLWNKIVEIFTPVVEFFKGVWEKVKEIFTPVINYFVSIFTTIWNNLKIIIDNAKQIISLAWNFIKAIFTPIVKWFKSSIIDPIAHAFDTLWTGLKSAVKVVGDVIKNVFNGVIKPIQDVVNRIFTLFKEIGAKVGDVIGKAFKAVINGVMTVIENILNTPIKAINGLIGVINKLPGVNLTKLQTFKLPRLAKGGIINLPSRGVPVGGAIAGERGAEGVIPLTDSQQMDLLGEAIGKHIVINATVPVYVGNRQVARELRKIEAEDNFAYNK